MAMTVLMMATMPMTCAMIGCSGSAQAAPFLFGWWIGLGPDDFTL
jgi:hypothetical protein